jgi:predicted DCC family thiol-disulfide oxidoreductase YuxK
MALIQTDGARSGADAALGLCAYLKAPLRWLGVGRVLPATWRHGLYRAIARRRIRWFGRVDRCELPDAGAAARFLSAA